MFALLEQERASKILRRYISSFGSVVLVLVWENHWVVQWSYAKPLEWIQCTM